MAGSLNDLFLEVSIMRLFISLSAAMILAVVALTACNSTDGSGSGSQARSQSNKQSPSQSPAPAAKPTQQGDGVPRVTTAELKEALDNGTAIVIDVRTEEQYKAGHIKGALHIPEAQIADRAGELPRDKKIVTYCS
jgi:predicted small secreted protein